MDVEPNRQEQNMARWIFSGSLGVVAGPIALSTAATLNLGWRGLFVLFAGLTLIPPAVAYRFRLAIRQRGAARAGFKAGLVGTLPALRRGEVLRWLTLLEFSDLIPDELLGFLGLYFVDVVGATPAQAGMAVWTGLGLLGNLLLIPLLERVPGLRYLRLSATVELGLFPAFCWCRASGPSWCCWRCWAFQHGLVFDPQGAVVFSYAGAERHGDDSGERVELEQSFVLASPLDEVQRLLQPDWQKANRSVEIDHYADYKQFHRKRSAGRDRNYRSGY